MTTYTVFGLIDEAAARLVTAAVLSGAHAAEDLAGVAQPGFVRWACVVDAETATRATWFAHVLYEFNTSPVDRPVSDLRVGDVVVYPDGTAAVVTTMRQRTRQWLVLFDHTEPSSVQPALYDGSTVLQVVPAAGSSGSLQDAR
jgi:hypothetical protein